MALQDLTPQLRTRLRRVEKIVGLFVVLAVTVLLAGFAYYLYHTAQRKGWFIPKCPYYTFVMSGDGLQEGDPVMLMGFSVGEITLVTAQPPGSWYKVYIEFEVQRPYYGYIWSDSVVRIIASGFLGSRRLEIEPGFAGAPTVYEENGRITEVLLSGKREPFDEGRKPVFIKPEEETPLAERAQALVGQVEKALPGILGLTNQVQAVLANTTSLTANANALLVDTRPVVTNLAFITANLRDPRGSLGEWLIPPHLNDQLATTVTSAHMAVTNINLQISLLTASLNQTLLNLAAITSNLNEQVQANDQMLSEISSLVIQTDDLIQGLKRHWLLRGAFPQSPSPPGELKLQPRILPAEEGP